MRGNRLAPFALLLVFGFIVAAVAPALAAGELEVFAGQDKTARVGVPLIFNDAKLVKPDPPDPQKTYSFAWDFDATKDLNLDGIYDNDNESTNLLTEHIFTAPGTFTVTLTVTDNTGGMAKDTLKVTVVDNLPPEITAQDSLLAYVNTMTVFNASATDDFSPAHLLRWEWDFGDGAKDNDAPPVEHTYTTVRAYQCRIRVYDPDQAWSEKIIYVDVREKPGENGTTYKVPGSGKLVQRGKMVRENGYIIYELPANAKHDLMVKVSADATKAPVAVFVFGSESSLLDYEIGADGTWDKDISQADMTWQHKVTWKSSDSRTWYIAVDSGYQGNDPFNLYSGPSVVDVTVQDLDRGNILVDIPMAVWIFLVIVAIVVVAFYFGMKLMDQQAMKKKDVEAIQKTKLQRDVQVSSLKQFLDNPEEVVKRESSMAQHRPPPGAPRGQPAPPPYAPGQASPPWAGPGPGQRGPPPRGPPPRAPPPPPPDGAAPPLPPPPEEAGLEPAPAVPPETYTAPKIVSEGSGPAYISTEPPKRGGSILLEEDKEGL